MPGPTPYSWNHKFAPGGDPSKANELMPTDFGPMEFAPIGMKMPTMGQSPEVGGMGSLPLPGKPANPFLSMPMAPRRAMNPQMPSQQEQSEIPQPQQMYPSGYDPSVSNPGSMSWGSKGPQNLADPMALEGLRNAKPHPLLQLAGMSELPQAGENPEYAARAAAERRRFIQQQLAPQQAQQEQIGGALAQQHPAILGLNRIQAEQKAMPQQLEAMGRIKASQNVAAGQQGAARLQGDSRTQAAIIGLLAPLMKQLGDAQQRAREFSGDGYEDFEQPNQFDQDQLNTIINQLLGRPEFSY